MKSFIGSFAFIRSAPKSATSNSFETRENIKEAKQDSIPTTRIDRKAETQRDIRMPRRNRVINKLALVLISLVVLELVLIGDQVQPVKAIKKKIYLKKLKKLLPLFALVKPKKKIILLPIPIPIFKSHNSMNQNTRPHQTSGRPTLMVSHEPQYPSTIPGSPMSFIMMDNEARPIMNPSSGYMMDSSSSASALPMTMSSSNNFEPIVTEPATTTTTAASATTGSGNTSTSPEILGALAMLGPSMTMTIQSEPGGGSNIELSTTNMNGQSGALIQQRPYGTKWRPNLAAKQVQRPPLHPNYQPQTQQLQQQVHQNTENFDEPAEQPGGEQYYSSPWMASRLVSPGKLLRTQKQQNWPNPQQGWIVRAQQQPQLLDVHQHQQHATQPLPLPPPSAARLQLPAGPQKIGPQWRAPAQFLSNWHVESARQQQQQQQQISQALEQEDLLPVGPAQEMPVYQAPNGQLHISLPPALRPLAAHPSSGQIEQEREPLKVQQNSGDDQGGDEVQTLPGGGGQGQPEPARIIRTTSRPNGQLQQLIKAYVAHRPPSAAASKTSVPLASGRLVSPAVKGKQQQQQLQQLNQGRGTEQKTIAAAGY